MAENDGGIGSHDSIQGNRVDRWLHEANAFIGRDREAIPVENGLVGDLLDVQMFRIDLLNVGVPADHGAIAREGHNQAWQQNLERGQEGAEDSVQIRKSTPPASDCDPLGSPVGHRSCGLLLYRYRVSPLHDEESLYKRCASEGVSRWRVRKYCCSNELQQVTVGIIVYL